MDSSGDEQIKLKKKKYSKKANNVPLDTLGFKIHMHADTIDPRNIKRKPNKSRKNYIAKSSKQNFMARLRMILDVYDLPPETQSHLFRVTKKGQWNYVKKVFYRSREKVFCYICLQQNIIAPQITFCGHIYCFHCILMHFKKSSNCFACPVCKQIIDKQQMKTCEVKYQFQATISEQIVFDLKYRQGHYIYSANTLKQDTNTAQIIRMRTKGIQPIFQNQLQEIRKQLNITANKDRNYQFLVQAMTISTEKIKNLQKYIASTHVNLRDNQILQNDTILRFITQQQQKKLNTFYQQRSGSLIFLHKLCKKYVNFTKQNQPLSITSVILQKQQIDFSTQQNDYKQISLFDMGLEVDAIIINITNYTTQDKLQKFKSQFELLVKQRQRIQKQQQVQLERIRIEYEEGQQYIKKLKQQQQAQFYFDVKLPPTLDPSDINQHSFPSLMTHKSDSPTIIHKQQIIDVKIGLKATQSSQKQKKFDLSKQSEESFPDLTKIQQVKSEEPKLSKNCKKKKKGKLIDVTHQFLFNRGEDQND